MPGGLLLFSPWCDPVGTHIGPAAEKSRANIDVDYLKPWSDSPRASGSYAVKSYLGDMPREVGAKNPYIGPASLELEPSIIEGMFTGFPSTYILSGDAELLVDEIRTLGQRMTTDLPKGRVIFDEVLDAVHDFVAFPFWEPERSSAFQRIISWIQEL
jgi:acetyl esterase/lipase